MRFKVLVLCQKILLNLKLDLKWLLFAPVGLGERIHYCFSKYISILRNDRQIRFLGSDFFFDGRLMPALLPEYVEELYRCRDFLADRKTLLDIGANIGQFAYAGKKLFPHLQIYSFEPNPTIFPLLLRNAQPYHEWTCFNLGLSTKNESLPFFFVPGKSGQGSIYRENAVQGLLSESAAELKVEFRTFDETLIDELKLPSHFDFVKVDVEGAERQVLKTLGGISWRYLLVELSENRAGSITLNEAQEILRPTPAQNLFVRLKSEPAGPSQTIQVLFERT